MPALPIIIYAIIASQNLTHSTIEIALLFQCALLPFFALIAVFTLQSFLANRQNKKITKTLNWRGFWSSLSDAKYEIPLPIFIYSFVYLGIFTILETSLFTAIYSCVVVFFIKKDLKLHQQFVPILIASLKLSGAVFMVMAGSLAFKEIFVQAMIPEKIFTFISGYVQNKYLFLITINLFLLIVGSFLDIFSAILIVLPILLPIVENYQINPYHFAIIFLINLEIGYLTPPMGMNLFIASYRFKQPVSTLYRASLPFLFWMIIVLIIFTYIPILSTFSLPKNQQTSDVSIQNLSDNIPPGIIKSIELLEAGSNHVTITFIASGNDDYTGNADSYIIGYSENKIVNLEDFEFEAQKYPHDQKPKSAGETETITITNLKAKTTYYIAIVVVDGAQNKSALSISRPIKTL